ncbi:MAG: cysteine desulfurase-like protein [Acidobacteria bacterium]|nr:MAG: cysteine desulfurase-like protein [Acidobacteriota bacterium]
MTNQAQQTIKESTSSVEEIRSHFPALERRHADYAVAYFDGPGGTQVPRAVGEAVTDYLYHHNANTHWAYPTSEETDSIIAAARETVAEFLNAHADEVAFGANMTTLAFHLSRALAPGFKTGDEIIITELDHHANVAPWRILERERGVLVRAVKLLPESGELDWDEFSRLLCSRTKLVAIGAASNALGTINDVRRAAEMAHAVQSLIFVDAVHFVPHALTDVRALNCDFLSCSAYKFYGPHIGVLFGKEDLLQRLDFPKLLPVWEGLSEIEGVTLYGPSLDAARTPTISFTARDVPSTIVARGLAELGVFVSHGDFYAATVIERLGLSDEGLVRAGCACYTTAEEVERLLAGVRAIADMKV